MKKYCWLLFFPAFIFLSACVKDKPEEPDRQPVVAQGEKIWVANEGSLGNGNASLSLILPQKDSIYNQVFANKNNQNLGDVFQSMAIVGNRLFMAINNSDQIRVIDKNDFRLLGSISIPKPRYMLLLDSTKMYVSSLFYPKINIVNPATMQLTGSISTDYPNTEGLLAFEGKVYACNWDTACNYLYELNPGNDQITHRISLGGYAPQQVLADKEGKLWVLAGNIEKSKAATLTRIDPDSRTILKVFHFPADAEVLKPVWNVGKDTMYFLGVDYNGGTGYNGVFRMPIHAQNLPAQPFIPAQPLQYFWALGIDPASGNIYVGDPKGFLQQGCIGVYDTGGKLLRNYTCGLGPGFFLFEKK